MVSEEASNDEEDACEEDDEMGIIPESMVDIDELEQDIDDDDRQVLNDRILGIINVF